MCTENENKWFEYMTDIKYIVLFLFYFSFVRSTKYTKQYDYSVQTYSSELDCNKVPLPDYGRNKIVVKMQFICLKPILKRIFDFVHNLNKIFIRIHH